MLKQLLTRLRRKPAPGRAPVLMFGPATTFPPVLARTLVDNETFRSSFRRASDFVEARRGWSMWEALPSDTPPRGVTATERNFVQESVLQLCLFHAFRELDVAYDAISAISIGEIAAAHAAGAVTFEESLHIGCEMIRVVLDAQGGDLVIVRGPSDAVRSAMKPVAMNSVIDWPVASVWAVSDEMLRPMKKRLREAGIAYTRLHYGCLSHTERIDRSRFAAALGRLPSRQPTRPLYSTVTGGEVHVPIDEQFWVRMISEPCLMTGMWQQVQAAGFGDVIYFGSLEVDQAFFEPMPSAYHPRSFTRADLLVVPGAQRTRDVPAVS